MPKGAGFDISKRADLLNMSHAAVSRIYTEWGVCLGIYNHPEEMERRMDRQENLGNSNNHSVQLW